EHPIFSFFVAEKDGVILGTAIYYMRYSTWKGKRLYLEDLIVTKKARGSGLGLALLDGIVKEAKSTNCTGVMWQVLDWNEPAIRFYEKYGASIDKGWLNCNVDF
ncbi:MAG: GNAT family N-acetyltransferase, partial [Cyclobacteriaceae bacterium]